MKKAIKYFEVISIFFIFITLYSCPEGALENSPQSQNSINANEKEITISDSTLIICGNANNPVLLMEEVSRGNNTAMYTIRIKDISPAFFKFCHLENRKTDHFNDINSLLYKEGSCFYVDPFITLDKTPDTLRFLLMDFSLSPGQNKPCSKEGFGKLFLDGKITYFQDTIYKFRIKEMIEDVDYLIYASPYTSIKGIAYVCPKELYSNKQKIMQFAGFIPDFDNFYFQNTPNLSCGAEE